MPAEGVHPGLRARALTAAVVGATAFAGIEAAAGADGLRLARLALLGGALGAVAVHDLAAPRIPNPIVLPTAAGCAALALAAGDRFALAGGLAVVAALLAVSLLRPAALGMGDVKLALLVVAGLAAGALLALVLGVALAGLYGLALALRHGRQALRRTLPLAPFVAAGTLVALLLTAR